MRKGSGRTTKVENKGDFQVQLSDDISAPAAFGLFTAFQFHRLQNTVHDLASPKAMAHAGRLLHSAGAGPSPNVASVALTSNKKLKVTLPDASPAAPAFSHGVAYFARPFVQRWVAVATGMSTGMRGPPKDVHYLSRVMMEGGIGTCWGVPIFHFTGKELDHSPSDSVGSPRSPRKGQGKKGQQSSSSSSSGSQRPKRSQEYALIFRFWQEDRQKHGGLTLAGNEYPAGPMGTDVIGTVA